MENQHSTMELNQTQSNSSRQSFSIDFDLYTDGDDEFKQELISLIISNIEELLWSLEQGLAVFKKVCHKIKSTTAIIGDSDFDELIHCLSNEHIDQDEKCSKTNMLIMQCNTIIKYLDGESH